MERRASALLCMPVVMACALDLARGLAYLHENCAVHGDLTAENVLLQVCVLLGARTRKRVQENGVSAVLVDNVRRRITWLGLLANPMFTQRCSIEYIVKLLCELVGDAMYETYGVTARTHLFAAHQTSHGYD